MSNSVGSGGQLIQGKKYALTGEEDENDFWGFARDARGFFSPLEEEGWRQVEFVRSAPQGGLLASLDHVGGRRAVAGNAYLDVLDAEGVSMGSYFVNDVTVLSVRPSPTGADLVDVTVRMWCDQAMPGSGWVWELIRAGRLTRTGLWQELDAAGRRAWLSVALWSHRYQRRGIPDAPAGTVFTLDGRHIVDLDSFYCALGEAVNGPGGYFGWNLNAVDDCLRGRWGATPPFTLDWQHSTVARTHLVNHPTVQEDPAENTGESTAEDATEDAATPFALLLQIFEERGVEVLLN
ncbi:barstar family protein [Streptomyces sp. N2A]|uniref:barstar family protein n=1 Tax=Streptomyces sp. N2A TaxID=3073936 RepID=UPI0028703C5A|nr:barstar family protein [Streptomyces sp. N2A]